MIPYMTNDGSSGSTLSLCHGIASSRTLTFSCLSLHIHRGVSSFSLRLALLGCRCTLLRNDSIQKTFGLQSFQSVWHGCVFQNWTKPTMTSSAHSIETEKTTKKEKGKRKTEAGIGIVWYVQSIPTWYFVWMHDCATRHKLDETDGGSLLWASFPHEMTCIS